MQKRKWFFTSLLILVTAAIAVGCQNIGYYKQAVSGQMEMMTKRESIPELIANPKTSPKLKEKFELILALRSFARTNLNMETGGHYLSYVDLHRSNAVWNVYAAPELSLKPKSWWYPVVGSVTYRGYFSESAAERYAGKIRKQGFDVFVGGVDAYSTLGWFKDPVLNTFVADSERRLASLIFHELAHQRVFISGDTKFNEAFATAVAEEGLRRWLEAKGDFSAFAKYQGELNRKKQFLELVRGMRDNLNAVYNDWSLSDATKRQKKSEVFERARADYAEIKKSWGGYASYDEWFADSLNNAKLNTVSAYYDLVPAFHQLIKDDGGDLQKFFARAKSFAKMSKIKRHEILAQIKVKSSEDLLAFHQGK